MSASRVKRPASQLAVSGSLAYDRIMDFPGVFSDHILPGQTHNLNLSFFLSGLRQSDGGTAGNIAYNLALLGERPTILGVAGPDFFPYRERLANRGVDVSRIKVVSGEESATAHIITDQKDNQIAAFYPGPLPQKYARSAAASLGKIELAIIAPDDKKRMLEYSAIYQRKGIKFIFDPGQAVIAFSGAELRRALKGAAVLIGNDYEIKLITDKMKVGENALNRVVPVIVTTKGGRGSEILWGGKSISIKPAQAKDTSDPTGAGDAYRAGFIKGMLLGYDLETCGRLGSVAAVYTVEKFGTQTHSYTLAAFRRRYLENYKESVKL